MDEIIYYGVGHTLRQRVQEYLGKTGIPICLCDRHEEKWHTMFTFPNGEQRQIISVPEAKLRYPEAKFYLTLAPTNLESGYHSLIQGGGRCRPHRVFRRVGVQTGMQVFGTILLYPFSGRKCLLHSPISTWFAL